MKECAAQSPKPRAASKVTPLMPFLFLIGIQGVLEEVATQLEDGEQLCAFLDDVYLLCQPARVEPLFKVLEEAMMRIAGIRLHQGKTLAWNKAGVMPDNIMDIGAEVWQPEGITVLGTPIGSEFLHRREDGREDLEGEAVVGCNSVRARPSVRVADLAAEREPSGEPHHENHAPKLVGSVLSGPRRVHRHTFVGRDPRRER